MPAASPPLDDSAASSLAALGQALRDHRKTLRVSATTAAEAAGMSRVTLHRIERGEPSVTMGAYCGAAAALGLRFTLVAGLVTALPDVGQRSALPATVRLADYPALQRLAWQLDRSAELAPADALALYERNWRQLDATALLPAERALVDALTLELGGGRLLA